MTDRVSLTFSLPRELASNLNIVSKIQKKTKSAIAAEALAKEIKAILEAEHIANLKRQAEVSRRLREPQVD